MGAGANIARQISERYEHLSEGQRAVARFVVEHEDRVALMDISMTAKEAGVSPPTVVRFAQALGFSGYLEFRSMMAARALNELTTSERFSVARIERKSPASVVAGVLEEDRENLSNTLANLDAEAVEGAARALADARTVFVVGIGGSAYPAKAFARRLRAFRRSVEVATGPGAETYFNLNWVEALDAVVGVSFPRHFAQTIEAIRFARGRGAETIAVTDSRVSPAALEASIPIVVSADRRSLRMSTGCVMALLDGLAIAVGSLAPNASAELDAIAEQNDRWVIQSPPNDECES